MVIAAVATGLLKLAALAEDRRVEWSGWGFAFGALVVLAGSDDVARLWGDAADGPGWQGVMRWTAGGAMAALLAWRASFAEGRKSGRCACRERMGTDVVCQVVG